MKNSIKIFATLLAPLLSSSFLYAFDSDHSSQPQPTHALNTPRHYHSLGITQETTTPEMAFSSNIETQLRNLHRINMLLTQRVMQAEETIQNLHKEVRYLEDSIRTGKVNCVYNTNFLFHLFTDQIQYIRGDMQQSSTELDSQLRRLKSKFHKYKKGEESNPHKESKKPFKRSRRRN